MPKYEKHQYDKYKERGYDRVSAIVLAQQEYAKEEAYVERQKQRVLAGSVSGDGCCGGDAFDEEELNELGLSFPDGVVETNALPPFIFTPAYPVRTGPKVEMMIDWQVSHSPEMIALPVFTSPARLRASLGQHQPWGLFFTDDVRVSAATKRISAMMLNPPSGIFKSRWTEEYWIEWKAQNGIK